MHPACLLKTLQINTRHGKTLSDFGRFSGDTQDACLTVWKKYSDDQGAYTIHICMLIVSL
jgi:hypothetical protein